MTTTTLTLTDFLLARIAEDEVVAREAVISAHDGHKPHPELREWQYAPWTPGCSGEVEYVQTTEMLDRDYSDRLYVTCDGEGLSPSVQEHIGPHIARHDPQRVLAECAAKRAIVTSLSATGWASYAVRDVIFEHLASVYANHDDFQDEWR